MFNSLNVFNGGPSSPPSPPLAGSTLREAIYSLLSTSPALAALVDDRIYPGGIPQEAVYPAVSYVGAGKFELRSFKGAVGLASSRVRVSCWSYYAIDSAAIATVIRNRLVGFRGLVGQVRIRSCSLINEIDLPENPTKGTDLGAYQIVVELRVWHRF